MMLWVQIGNLLFFVGKSSFHKRHTSKDCHFDSGHVWQKCLKFDILKILHQKCIDFKEEAILKNSYNSSTLFPLGRDTFYHCASRNRVKTMIQTLYTLNCTQNQSYIGIQSTLNCCCNKILNHGLNYGLFLSLFKFLWWKYFQNWIQNLVKVIHTKYSKHWPYTVAHTIDCVGS